MTQRKVQQRALAPIWHGILRHSSLCALLVLAGLLPGWTGPHDVPTGDTWSLQQFIRTDGTLQVPVVGNHLCTDWQILLDPASRARLVRTSRATQACAARSSRPAPYWDDQLHLPGVICKVRAIATPDAIYVDGQFHFVQHDITVSGILRWDATTGRWEVLGASNMTPHLQSR